MKKNPLVSIIIPLRELSYYLLYENLPELQKQTYEKYEIIVLPNEHVQYDLALLKKYKKLRIIPTGKITRPAQKRDIGVEKAKGDIIAFLDDDAYPDPNWIQNAVKLFQRKNIQAVCGPGVLPSNTNVWEQIFDEVLKSWIGAGSYIYRFVPKKRRYVTDYPSMNFFIMKKTFIKLGGFNSNYWPGEDSKLCNDLIEKEKGKILYSPDVCVYHHRRNNLTAYLKQHANYGFHRGAFAAHGDKNSQDVAYMIPTFLVLYFIAFLIYTFVLVLIKSSNYYYILIPAIPLFLYSILVLYLFGQSFIKKQNLIISIGACLTLVLTHFVYGIMFIKGYTKGIDKNQNIYG